MTDFDWSEVTNKNLRTWGVHIQRAGQPVGAVSFTKDVTYIGRMPENTIVLEDARISRSHAKVTCVGGQYFIEDQQSENGFSVNGEKVQAKWLALGDQITMGEFVLKVVDHAESFQAAQAATAPQGLEDRTVSLIEPAEPSDITLILSLQGAPQIYRLPLSEDEAAALRGGAGDIFISIERDGRAVLKKPFRRANP